MRLLIALLLLGCAPCLWADFSAEVSGTLRDSAGKEKFAGVTVTLSFDPMRGCGDYRALAAMEKKQGPLAMVTVTGSATTDADGNFTMTAEFKLDGEGKFPTTKAGGNKQVNTVSVLINIDKDGYLKDFNRAQINEGGAVKLTNVYPVRIPELKGKLLHLAGRKAAAGVELSLRRYQMPGMDQPLREVTTKTDATGAFRFYDAYGPDRDAILSVTDTNTAFVVSSSAREIQRLDGGKSTDLGNIMVVPGGGLKLRCIDGESADAVSFTAGLTHESGTQIGGQFVLGGEWQALVGHQV